ncbi:MAG: hypothetical protein S4CHLAM102_00960 [Chlamydiia bacterium]|nr:hypothetical protein [Chlamydiia bacterium]
MDDIGDNTPHLEVRELGHSYWGKFGVFGEEEKGIILNFDPFDSEFAIDHGDDDGAIRGFEGAVDDEDVSVVDGSSFHRLSFDADEEGSGWMGNEKCIEVERLFYWVISWRGKACLNSCFKERNIGWT